MNSNEENNFEDQWREAFASASEQPNEALWQRIEQQLDKDDPKTVPFWYNYAKYIAVALVLVGLGSYWTMKHEQKQITTTAKANKNQVIERRITIENQIIEKTKNSESENIATQPKVGTNNIRPITTKQPVGTNSIRPIATQQTVGTYSIRPITTQPAVGTDNIRPITTEQTVETYSISPQSQAISISALDIKDLKNLTEPAQNQLIVSFKEDLPIKDPVVKWRKHWISFGVSVASFNPHISLPPSNSWLPYSYSNVQQKPIVSNLNEGTTPSFSVQISGGIKMRGRLGLESGIGFLMGNSVYETTVLTIDNQRFSAISDAIYNSSVISNLTNKQLSSQASINFSPVPATNGNFSTQKVRNDYQFVQIPILVSYDVLLPSRKTGLALLAGITSSVMIQNRIQNVYQQDVIYKNGVSSPYHRLSFASTFGLRGNYRLSQSWNTTLTVNYQRTIQSLEKTNVYFTTKPQLFGVGLGLQYQF
jgi:hypothetical protein